MAARGSYIFQNYGAIPPVLEKRLCSFFEAWDDYSNDSFLDFLVSDVVMDFGSRYEGQAAVKGFRDGSFGFEGPLRNCQHTLDKVFELAGEAQSGRRELIVQGRVCYRLKNGQKVPGTFATYMVVVQQPDGDWKCVYDQVYTDPTKLIAATEEMQKPKCAFYN
jgi:ketosteroid isomerase-like protein